MQLCPPVHPSSQEQLCLPPSGVHFVTWLPHGLLSHPVGDEQSWSSFHPSSQEQLWLAPLAVHVPWLPQGLLSQPVGWAQVGPFHPGAHSHDPPRLDSVHVPPFAQVWSQ